MIELVKYKYQLVSNKAQFHTKSNRGLDLRHVSFLLMKIVLQKLKVIVVLLKSSLL